MALTEVEQRLLDGFIWLASTGHEAHHRGEPYKDGERSGPPDFKTCTFKTCRYAAEIVTWCQASATIPRDERTT